MIVLQILIAVIAAIGLGFILSDAFRIPKFPVSKAITTLGKRQKKKTNPLDIWLGDLANRIAGKLKLNEYKRLQLKADLDSADMTVSPEQYVANAIVKALFIGIFAIPFLFFAPILSLLIAVIAVVIYFTEYKKVGKIIRGKRQRIEYELPRLVSNIDKTLVHSRDVLGILDSYREHAGEDRERHCAQRLPRLSEMDAGQQGHPAVRPIQGFRQQADSRSRRHLLLRLQRFEPHRCHEGSRKGFACTQNSD